MIPLGTDRPSSVTPRVTLTILVVNLLVWLACVRSPMADELYRALGLSGLAPRWWQYATYQFVHDRTGFWHILGNAVFFWTFGSALECRMGSLPFAAFFLALGTSIGLLYPTVAGPFGMLIGASGTVCACSGAFAVFYPRARVIVLFWGIWRVPALWFVAIFIALDAYGGLRSRVDDTAYAAHLLGYATGVVTAFVLLVLKVYPRDDFDLFFILKQRHRRAQMRSALAGRAGGAFESVSRGDLEAARVTRSARTTGDDRIPQARARLTAALRAAEWPKVLEECAAIDGMTAEWALPESLQLELANGLQERGHHELAAKAYARFMRAYPRSPHAEGVQLMLATICIRYLRDMDRARATIALLRAGSVSAPTAALLERLEQELAS